jgi:hypothetical protein
LPPPPLLLPVNQLLYLCCCNNHNHYLKQSGSYSLATRSTRNSNASTSLLANRRSPCSASSRSRIRVQLRLHPHEKTATEAACRPSSHHWHARSP